jgi:hypothetical protein
MRASAHAAPQPEATPVAAAGTDFFKDAAAIARTFPFDIHYAGAGSMLAMPCR